VSLESYFLDSDRTLMLIRKVQPLPEFRHEPRQAGK
jgi:hypothetical protein